MDRLFVATEGIDINVGVTEYNMNDALVKQTTMKNAKEVLLAADRSKFNKVSFIYAAKLSEIDLVITGMSPPNEIY